MRNYYTEIYVPPHLVEDLTSILGLGRAGLLRVLAGDQNTYVIDNIDMN
jgi:hypothetical protein